MRRAATLLLALLPSLSAASVARADATHAQPARIAYIRDALTAVAATPRATLDEAASYARVMAHGACASPTRRLQVECMMTAARQFCRGKDVRRCGLALDVLVSNVIADEELIPPEKRYQIMRDNKDYRRALAAETRRLQGALAVDFRLRTHAGDDDADLARAIDDYCLASADDHDLPWQACVSSLVWFIRGEAHAQ